jgi:glycerol-3-phosphate dehydrogenase
MYRPSLWYRFKLRVGMFLYDLLSLDKSLPRRKWLGRAETLAAEPTLDPDGLAGAWRFYDAQVPFVERLVLENVIDAAEHGALVLNHTEATAYLRDGDRITGARAYDRVGERDLEIRARITVTATGPWLDTTLAPLRDGKRPLLRLTKGIHLVTPKATRHAHVLFARDGRLFFVVPWGEETIVGTTDTDFDGDARQAAATKEDVEYLRDAAHQAFPNAPFDRVLFTWAGVRALVREEGVSESEVSRKHALYDHAKRDGLEGALSVVGGKITAYRDIAEEATDAAARSLGARARSTTAEAPLPGARDDRPRPTDWEIDAHLASLYGSRAGDVIALARAEDGAPSRNASLRGALCPHHHGIGAEIDHAVRSEWAVTLGDVLLRRMLLGLEECQGLDCIDAVADRMAELLGWDQARRADEIARYRAEIEPMRRFRTA